MSTDHKDKEIRHYILSILTTDSFHFNKMTLCIHECSKFPVIIIDINCEQLPGSRFLNSYTYWLNIPLKNLIKIDQLISLDIHEQKYILRKGWARRRCVCSSYSFCWLSPRNHCYIYKILYDISFSTAFVGIFRGQLPSSGLILHNIDMIYVHRKRKYSFLMRFNVIVYIHALYTC